MSLSVFLKNNLKNIPPAIGLLINKLPYAYRPGIGKVYRERRQQITEFSNYSEGKKKQFVFERMKALVDHAYQQVPFYREYYTARKFDPRQLKSFDDLEAIPIVDKAILKEYPLEYRSAQTKGRYLVNTGGSTGTPFSLYIEPSSMGHEWAHMHHLWEKLGYRPTDLKLLFGGRSDLNGPLEYDVLRNHFAVDIYSDYALVAKALKKQLTKYSIPYLHGYPSAIYDFALYVGERDPELIDLLKKTLKGVFLGSEYPQTRFRSTIEKTFDVPSISWYGHTERCILAGELEEKYTYNPFCTYGYTEAEKANDEGDHYLIGTSYYNFASPLIRYNTNDLIADLQYKDAILSGFRIAHGREGEFVVDAAGKKISLTGLIFGRHHELFNSSDFIQVRQPEPGRIEIHYVSTQITEGSARELFDHRNLNFQMDFIRRDAPVRTSSGKVNLLIK